MRRTTRRRPSKLALTLSLFFLSSLAAVAASSSQPYRRSWRPDTELPGAKFVIGDGKTEGTKAKGYEGEWPLWSSFRKSKSNQDSTSAVNSGSTPPSSSSASSAGNSTTYVCAPIGECGACPEDVIHLPYCRPYNNRRRVACSPVADRDNPTSIQSALDSAKSSSSSSILGYEACGKSARQEARDYFEMIAVIASIAIFSVWAFIERQKLLFQRQSAQLQSRVSGQRRASGPSWGGSALQGHNGRKKKRAARLVNGR